MAKGTDTARSDIDLMGVADDIEYADVEAGLWDRARADVWRVDWMAPEHRVRIWSGQLSEVTRQGASFAAELVSLKADLERPVGRVYARNCDAEIGDARCRFDLSPPEFRGEAEVETVTGDKSFTADGLDAFPGGWFAGGAITWTSRSSARLSLAMAMARAKAAPEAREKSVG